MQLDNNKHGERDMYIVIRKMVQSLKDTDNRTLGYNSCCALHYKSSCVFRVFITRHGFAQMERMFWYVGQERFGDDDDGEGSKEKGRTQGAGTDSIFGHTSE